MPATESDSLLKGPVYGTLQNLENAEDSLEHMEQINMSKPNGNHYTRLYMWITLAIVLPAVVFLSSGRLMTTRVSHERSLKAFAKVNPGESLKNGDEMWPCIASSGGSCPNDNVYTSTTVPFKMVFYQGEIFLFAKARSESLIAWGSLFEVLTAKNEDPSTIGWGEPYWKLSEDPDIKSRFSPDFTPEEIMANGLNHMVYRLNPENKPQIAFQKASIVDGKAVFEDLTVYTGRANQWGCDKITFMLTTDGNLLLVPYSSFGAKNCGSKLPFVSKNYKDLGGTTRVPTSEPTYGPGMPTPEPTAVPSFKPTVAPTIAFPTGMPTSTATSTKKKNGGNKKKNNKKRKNKKKNKNKNKKKNRKNRNKKNRKNRNKKNRKNRNKKNKNKNKPKSVSELEEEEYIKEEEIESEDVQEKEVERERKEVKGEEKEEKQQ